MIAMGYAAGVVGFAMAEIWFRTMRLRNEARRILDHYIIQIRPGKYARDNRVFN